MQLIIVKNNLNLQHGINSLFHYWLLGHIEGCNSLSYFTLMFWLGNIVIMLLCSSPSFWFGRCKFIKSQIHSL